MFTWLTIGDGWHCEWWERGELIHCRAGSQLKLISGVSGVEMCVPRSRVAERLSVGRDSARCSRSNMRAQCGHSIAGESWWSSEKQQSVSWCGVRVRAGRHEPVARPDPARLASQDCNAASPWQLPVPASDWSHAPAILASHWSSHVHVMLDCTFGADPRHDKLLLDYLDTLNMEYMHDPIINTNTILNNSTSCHADQHQHQSCVTWHSSLPSRGPQLQQLSCPLNTEQQRNISYLTSVTQILNISSTIQHQMMLSCVLYNLESNVQWQILERESDDGV